jgi:hypoxanthine phosphoribosyltransferase
MEEIEEFLSPDLEEIFRLTADLAERILKCRVGVDVVVGIARGGLLPARLFSDFLGVEWIEIIRAELYTAPATRKERPRIVRRAPPSIRDKRILLVDDVADSGDTIIEAVKHLKMLGASQVKVVVLYQKPWSRFKADFYAQETKAWIIFPWERVETMEKILERLGEKAYTLSGLKPETLRIVKRILNLRKGRIPGGGDDG